MTAVAGALSLQRRGREVCGSLKTICASRCCRAALLDAALSAPGEVPGAAAVSAAFLIGFQLLSPGALPDIELVEQPEKLVVVDVGPGQRVSFKHEALARQRQEVERRGRLVGQIGVAMACMT